MRSSVSLFVRVAVLLVLAGAPAPLPGAAAQVGAPLPGAAAAPGKALTVYLVTMGQGDAVWELFGHNGIWIHDADAGTDRVYHYGAFDFNSPGYWSRFVKGDWLYHMAVDDIHQTVYAYRYWNRSVQAQQLNLQPAQRAELQAFLEWNARPENREYLYDYFRDNCSTRVRDALDRALGGQLHATTTAVPTGTTYRWHSARLTAEDKASYTGLLAGLGPAADRPIDAWEEMFLPFKLEEMVRRVQVADAAGRAVPLVVSEQTLVPPLGRAGPREEPPFWLPWYLLAGVALGAALVGLARWARRSGFGRFLFAAVGSLWSLLIGTGGLVLIALWTLTNHTIAYRNENLFQFNPLALGLVLLLPALAYGARWAGRPARWLAFAVAGVALLGFVLQILPALDQVNGSLIALTLPVHLGLAWAVDQLAQRHPAEPQRLRAKRTKVQAPPDGPVPAHSE